jgi:hypothetical protein
VEISPERVAARAQERELVAAALASLPEADREVLLLCDVEGFSGEQTAISGFQSSGRQDRIAGSRFATAPFVFSYSVGGPRIAPELVLALHFAFVLFAVFGGFLAFVDPVVCA